MKRPAAATTAVVPPPSPAPAAAPSPPPDPAMLNNMTGAEVKKLMGTPQFQRNEDPAQLWRYASGNCLLDIYFHAAGRDYRVGYFEFRANPRHGSRQGPGDIKPGDAKPVDEGACFARLARQAGTVQG